MKPLPVRLCAVSSLVKAFPDTPVGPSRRWSLSGLQGETVAFQVLVAAEADLRDVRVSLDGALASHARIRRVGLVPVERGTVREDPSRRIDHGPGLYPDPLFDASSLNLWPGFTKALWISVRLPPACAPGRSSLAVLFSHPNFRPVRVAQVIEVVGAPLPAQTLLNTHWFYHDALCEHYGVEPWSREHWTIAETYLRNAADHGVNTILTPLFTPPLDTAVGAERLTTQLVDVTVVGRNRYTFGFNRLGQWIRLAQRCGITHFELSHLATQWGAKNCPKIMATVKGGRTRRIFGWDEDSTGAAYERFLSQFLPALSRFLQRAGVKDRCFLHVSDEPHGVQIEKYRQVNAILRRYAPDMPIMDACSHIEYFKEGLIDVAIPSIGAVQPYLDAQVPGLWTYYCCGPVVKTTNRFIDFPSERVRIIGMQMFKNRIVGFLHWGYNFWYSQLSRCRIDPYRDSTAMEAFPPGDGFVVYPGADGPVDSIRWEVFHQGLQDMRAFQLLEQLAGARPSPAVRRLLALSPLKSMEEFPRSAAWLEQTREAVNRAIRQALRAKAQRRPA